MWIMYQDNREYNYTNSGTAYTTFWNNISLKLLPKFILEVDMKTTGQTSACEGRFFIQPVEKYTGNSQPNPSAWCGFGENNTQIQAGTRTSSTNYTNVNVSDNRNVWWHFKLIKERDTFSWYYNDTLLTTKTLSEWNNYTNFNFSIVQWSNGNTLSIKNIKLTLPYTLNGSLENLGELMATQLTNKGVTASASDGLDTLADKILEI